MANEQAEILCSRRYEQMGYTLLEYAVEAGNCDGRVLRPVASCDERPPPGWRSNVVPFGGTYGQRRSAVDAFIREGVDVLLVVGCSGGVDVARLIVDESRHGGAFIIEINPSPSGRWHSDVTVREPATSALSGLNAAMGGQEIG